jgi:hypothetical protein
VGTSAFGRFFPLVVERLSRPKKLEEGLHMGNRANIVIRQHGGQEIDGNIWVYVHLHGSVLARVLQAALKRGRKRWNDETYLTRIIISQVAIEVGVDSNTGMGVSTYPTDNNHPWLIVDSQAETVEVSDEDFVNIRKKISFSDFCLLEDPDIRKEPFD